MEIRVLMNSEIFKAYNLGVFRCLANVVVNS
jgi:hypothetical protein